LPWIWDERIVIPLIVTFPAAVLIGAADVKSRISPVNLSSDNFCGPEAASQTVLAAIKDYSLLLEVLPRPAPFSSYQIATVLSCRPNNPGIGSVTENHSPFREASIPWQPIVEHSFNC
jgi:hypothetical protein